MSAEGINLTEWTGIFSDLYTHVDQTRTPEQIWINIMSHASTMGECIRTLSGAMATMG